MSAPEPFPWDEVTTLGLSVLRWSPSEFWRATPRELIAAWEGLNGAQRITPALGTDLKRLMQAFPDGEAVSAAGEKE